MNRGKKKGKGSSKVCTYCQSKGRPGQGHAVEKCWTKQRDEGRQAAAMAAAAVAVAVDLKPADMSTGSDNYAFTAMGNESGISGDRWIFDSAHFSYDPESGQP